ncbi:MAG: hypothetical protein R3E58_13660 [Phycisphaerae bacterium]
MLRHRQIILGLSILVVVGSISSAIGYAAYIRSESYRQSVEQQVGDYLGLRTTIHGVTPMSSSSRKFSGIDIFLPSLVEPTFRCTDAIWRLNAGDHGNQVALDLNSGTLVLDSNDLGPEEYKAMLESGLGHDFQALGLAAVQLNGFDIAWKPQHRVCDSGDRRGRPVRARGNRACGADGEAASTEASCRLR